MFLILSILLWFLAIIFVIRTHKHEYYCDTLEQSGYIYRCRFCNKIKKEQVCRRDSIS